MRIFKTLIILVLLFSGTAQAENNESQGEPGGGGIVYGSEIGIGVSAPAGWTFDSKSGIPQGLHGVMYPDGSKYFKSSRLMYVNIGKLPQGETLEEFIQGDIDSFKEASPNINVSKSAPIAVTGGSKAETRIFTGDKWGNFEQIAYQQKASSVGIYVLTCRTKEEFEKSQAAFIEMVSKSYLVKMVFKK